MIAILIALLASQALGVSSPLPVHLETRAALDSRLANVHLAFDDLIEGLIQFTYGSCESKSADEAHHTIGHGLHTGTERLVWIIPEDVFSGGCLAAWSETGNLLGRSSPQDLQIKSRKRSLKRSFSSG